jgi:hypothetical protein
MALQVTPPLLGFVIGTRAALAFGIGLLVADRIPADRRRRIGAALVAVGAATTLPAIVSLRRSRVESPLPSRI